MQTAKYVRKPFYIDAVQVTNENLNDVAQWCSGEARSDSDPANKRYIKVRVHRPLNERQTKAYVGDWVLFAGTGYKVYTPKAFAASFEQAADGSPESSNDLEWTDAFPDNVIDLTAEPAEKTKVAKKA